MIESLDEKKCSGCDICFPEPSLSRRHLMCTLRGSELLVRDLGSKNGTYLGSQRLEQAHLRSGVRLRAGNCFLRLEDEPNAADVGTGDSRKATVAMDEVGRSPAEDELPPEPVMLEVKPTDAAPSPSPDDLEGRVPDAEGFEEEEEPTPVEETVLQASASEEDDAARLIVKGDRWYVQDPATGIEVEIVPVQGEPGGPAAVEAGLPEVLPQAEPQQAAGLPALRQPGTDLAPIQATAVSAVPREGRLAGLWADPKKRWILIVVPVAAVVVIALAVALASVYLMPKPMPPPISRTAYRRAIAKAIKEYEQGDRETALATLVKLMKQPMRTKPRLAELFRDAVKADIAVTKDFAKSWDPAEDLWEEVKKYSRSPEPLRKIAADRLTWIQLEANNMASLNEAKRHLEEGDYKECLRFAANVTDASIFHKEAAPIVREAQDALLKKILSRAASAERARKWTDAIKHLREALEHDDSKEGEIKPKIAAFEKYERHRTSLEKARQLARSGRHADALRELKAIDAQSPYAREVENVRTQCQMRGAVQSAQDSYNAGNAQQALQLLSDAGLRSSGVYSKIHRVLEARKNAWKAMKENRFHDAESAWKSITTAESNKNNHYLQEAQRELNLLPARKRETAQQLAREANRAMDSREFRSAYEKFSEALLLDPKNSDAVEGLAKLKKAATMDYNLALNFRRSNRKKALQLLEDVMARLAPTDNLYTQAEREARRIREKGR